MSLFGSKKKSILGFDVGAGGIKLVELKNVKGRPQLHTYAYFERERGQIATSLFNDTKGTAELIKKMLKQSKTTTMRVVAGLPIASVFSSIISVPKADGRELKQAIEWQARKLIPLPLEEMVLDWKILGEEKKAVTGDGTGLMIKKEPSQFITGKQKEGPPELGRKILRVLLTAAAKNLVNKYVELSKLVGFELVALETEAFALIRSLVGKDPSSVMLIDFGSARSTLIIVDQGVPVLTRSINLGGSTITESLSKSLGIEINQIEQLKRDIEKLGVIGGEKSMPPVLQKILEPMVTEIKYSLNLYKIQQGESVKNVEKIIFTGGSAHLPYLTDYISKLLSINAFVGDPWARVLTHEDLRPVLDDIGPRFSVAIGLAMRDFE